MKTITALVACVMLCACGRSPGIVVAGGDPQQGKALIERYGCASCHTIPGAAGTKAQVGPPLEHIAGRAYFGGVVPNSTDNMVAWIRHPQQFAPRTAMPDLGVSEADARHIAAYLYTLH